MRELIKGSKEYVTMEMQRRTDASFTIESANYKVVDSKLQPIGDNGAAEIDEAKVFILVDTTKEVNDQGIYCTGKTYFVEFSVTIIGLPKVLIGRVAVRVCK